MDRIKMLYTENTIFPIEMHPEMLIKLPERDKRLDVITESEYTSNTETYD
ncbi:MAG: hypothetical protein VZR27_10000 [Acutalibacteraceae bacterium]|nr:hypothetical protein [Clostridia bacterium]MEE3451002.1 hypothetical protein [Acutalibacteraceae bacterium]